MCSHSLSGVHFVSQICGLIFYQIWEVFGCSFFRIYAPGSSRILGLQLHVRPLVTGHWGFVLPLSFIEVCRCSLCFNFISLALIRSSLIFSSVVFSLLLSLSSEFYFRYSIFQMQAFSPIKYTRIHTPHHAHSFQFFPVCLLAVSIFSVKSFYVFIIAVLKCLSAAVSDICVSEILSSLFKELIT